MNGYVRYHLVNKGVASNEMIFVYRGMPYIEEIREKAKELYKENKCDGVLFYIRRENPWGECTMDYYILYDGKKFKRNFELKWDKWK